MSSVVQSCSEFGINTGRCSIERSLKTTTSVGRDLMLGGGLVLSFATQLRFGSLPIGPGEVCLIAGLGWEGATILTDREAHTTPIFWKLAAFWAVFAMSEMLGFTVGGIIGDLRDTGLVVHDAMTFPLLAGLSLMISRGPDSAERINRLLFAVVGFAGALAVMELVGAAALFNLPGVDPWYWDRLRGWASNPNQLALACLLSAGLGVEVVGLARSIVGRTLGSITIAAAILAGFLTQTNAFNLAIAAAMALAIGLASGRAVLSANTTATRRCLALLVLIGLPIVGATVLPYSLSLASPPWAKFGVSRDGANTNDEAEVRLELWGGAVTRGIESGLLGLGPGPHLPIPSLLLEARRSVPSEPINIQHPSPGAAPNFESHNSFLELFLQGGLLAVGSFVVLAETALVSALKAGRTTLFATILGMLLFGSFHVVTRHPAVWFTLTLGLAARHPEKTRSDLGLKGRQ